MEYNLEIYSTEEGLEPFTDWLEALPNKASEAQILQRLQRIRLGNFGDCKPIEHGLWEFRIHSNSGFRVYYTRAGLQIILLLCGGNKSTQRRDIKQAKKYLEDYRRRFL